MDNDKLHMMGEQIVNNLAAYPEKELLDQSSLHIEQFWTQDMIDTLKQHHQENSNKFSTNLVKVLQKLN